MAKKAKKAETVSEPGRARTLVRTLVRRVLIVCLVLAAIPLILVPLYAVINPPITNTMIIKRLGGASIRQAWVPLSDMSVNLVRAVLVSEDERFCLHGGVDWRQVRIALREWDDGDRPRGASTITMQTVKNLFLWPERSYIRKLFEVPLAIYADLVWSKRRTMEIYLNIAEWDRGVYGAEMAAQTYFNRPASKLTRNQAALLAVTLPAPNARNPAKPGSGMRRLASRVDRRAQRSGAYVTCVLG